MRGSSAGGPGPETGEVLSTIPFRLACVLVVGAALVLEGSHAKGVMAASAGVWLRVLAS